MRIGIPKEIKPQERRVALLPEAAGELVLSGHEVMVQVGAGMGSGYADAEYAAAGVRLVPDAADLFRDAELVLKVKEPVGPELELLRRDHLLFSFLHLAALPDLTSRLLAIGLTAIGFETVADRGGLPLLAPMSDIAGRIAVQVGAHLLHATQGGKGRLLGGLPSVGRGRVVVLGAGNAGGNAARMAAAFGAEVRVLDRDPQRLAGLHHAAPNITALYSSHAAIEREVRQADLLVGSVLIPGARAPHLVSRELVAAMQPGSVIVDISVDQGGCIETTRPTDYDAPTFVEEGVVHFGVTNMPGAVPRSASAALSAALLPYVVQLAAGDWQSRPALAGGVNVAAGEIVHPALRPQ